MNLIIFVMSKTIGYILKAILGGFLIIVPIYLAILLLLKGMGTIGKLTRPFAMLLPDWVPAGELLSLLLVLLLCALVGISVRTKVGKIIREKIEKGLFERIPGYALFRSLTQQLAGESRQTEWKPALAEIEDALVPAFIIEEIEDSQYTVFVPSIPTPLAGAVYILEKSRVHPLDVHFTDALRVVSRWGSGAKELVAAYNKGRSSATS